MEITLSSKPLLQSTADVAIVFFLKEQIKSQTALKAFPAETKTLIQTVIKNCDFRGEPDQCFHVHTQGSPRTIILVGCGEKEKFSAEKLRLALSLALRSANGISAKEVAVSLAFDCGLSFDVITTAIAETAVMTSYKFDMYKTEKKPFVVGTVIIAETPSDKIKTLSSAVLTGKTLGELCASTRALVNTPPDVCTPEYFANHAQKLGKEVGFDVKVFDEKQLKAMNMQGILQVGSGSDHPPRLVVAEYKNGTGKKIAFVGKGVCFDSGGLDIKPASAMDTMKLDKAGASCVLNVLAGCARLKLKGHYLAVMPLVENMPGNDAYKPGDIIVTRSKKTIEVLNTDAEGRVILSDALYYAAEQNPDSIIDVATLTGACIIALGHSIAGLMGNNDSLALAIKNASAKTGEKVWELPMDDEFMEMIKSNYADVKNVVSNTPGSGGGTITAAKFLSIFVQDKPWVHLDIAGPAWASEEYGYQSIGATGYGTRLLLQYALDLNK